MAKHSGSIAIPFLITLLISLLLVGGAAFFFYRDYVKDDTVIQPLPMATASISEADRMTVLCVLDAPEGEVATGFLLYRFNPVTKKCVTMALPNNLLLSADGKSQTVQNIYTAGGVAALKKTLQTAFSLTVDRYMLFDSTSFPQFCDIIGGVEHVVAERIRGVPQNDSSQFLSGAQMQLVIQHNYEGGELQRSALIGSLISTMFNQMDRDRMLQTLDSYVSTVLDSVNTDFTALDYKEHKHAIRYMIQYVPAPNSYLFPIVTPNGDNLSMDEKFITTIQERFS